MILILSRLIVYVNSRPTYPATAFSHPREKMIPYRCPTVCAQVGFLQTQGSHGLVKGFLALAFETDESSLPEVLRMNSEQSVAAAVTSTGCPASRLDTVGGHRILSRGRETHTYVLPRLRWHIGLALGSDASS